jgi:integrase
MASITTNELKALSRQQGKWLSESITGFGHGSLSFRALSNGEVSAYYRYNAQGKRQSLTIGRYDPEGRDGFTLAQLRRMAGEFAKLHASGYVFVKEKIEAERFAEQEANRLRLEQERQKLLEEQSGTFEQLLDAYCEYLLAEGKLQSAKDITSTLKLWVKNRHPLLLPRKANSITKAEILSILKLVVDAGKTRTVNRVRSYLLAAYNLAISAESDALQSVIVGQRFDIVVNPVATTVRIRKFERVCDRVLADGELKDLLVELEDCTPVTRDAIKLALFMGGQRLSQLMRVSPDDVDMQMGTIRLLDGKGRRTTPREHLLPIPAQAVPIIKSLLEQNAKFKFLFTNDGKRQLSICTLSQAVREISKGSYQMRDLRRTCETMLAKLGVSKDIRAQLQSHGLSGVQDRHYDRYQYLPEKLRALNIWCGYLDRVKDGNAGLSNVVTLVDGHFKGSVLVESA